jgi:hypothetical protein
MYNFALDENISIHEIVEPVVKCRNSKLGTLLPLLMCATLWRAQFSSIFAQMRATFTKKKENSANGKIM